MRKFIILVDMDDVLNNLVECWVEAINIKSGLSVSKDEITSWDISKPFQSLNKNEVYSPLYDDSFWENLLPTKNSVKYLGKMIRDGHTVKIVTASVYQTIKTKMQWLFKHFPYLSWNDVIITQDKQMIIGDIIIDDGVHNLGGNRLYQFLIDQPHNRYYNAEDDGVYRVLDLENAYSIIAKKAKENCEYYGAPNDGDWEYCVNCNNGADDDGILYCKHNGSCKFELGKFEFV